MHTQLESLKKANGELIAENNLLREQLRAIVKRVADMEAQARLLSCQLTEFGRLVRGGSGEHLRTEP